MTFYTNFLNIEAEHKAMVWMELGPIEGEAELAFDITAVIHPADRSVGEHGPQAEDVTARVQPIILGRQFFNRDALIALMGGAWVKDAERQAIRDWIESPEFEEQARG